MARRQVWLLPVALALAVSSGAHADQPFGVRPSDAPRSGAPAQLLADLDAGPMTAKERQKACTEQWRRFSAAEKTAQGPGWPQFYSRCIKRLKASAG